MFEFDYRTYIINTSIKRVYIFMYFFTTVNNNKIICMKYFMWLYLYYLLFFCSPTFGSWTNRQWIWPNSGSLCRNVFQIGNHFGFWWHLVSLGQNTGISFYSSRNQKGFGKVGSTSWSNIVRNLHIFFLSWKQFHEFLHSLILD